MGKTYFEHGLYAIYVIRSYDKILPIFLMTADLSDEVRKEAERLGVNEMFKKPLDLGELVDKIRQYI